MSDPSQPWRGFFESDEDYEKRCDAARDEAAHNQGQEDAAEGRLPHEPWKGVFESDEDYDARLEKYKEGYENGQSQK